MKKLVLVLVLVLFGCGSAPAWLNTPNGNPQITVVRDAKRVREATFAWMLNKGYMVSQAPDSNWTVLEGSRNHETVGAIGRREQVTFNLLEKKNGQVTLFAFKSYLYTDGTALLSNRQVDYDELQGDLVEIAQSTKSE